ncbi:siphovirus Gp157 family protein [Hoeflea sp. WL0058]|uniref:Siphovirus Gp157 family protein n=1 Tax=Flavimaribacter sediminis TaxID=2865987 RepID=A0AAE2ZKF4_9HYPH|nr:siphovirus Gp157 family protein [Flavimaribacter sediminis]MBW8636220.1 siphovirus Gp157 family protein [Flavimaribacter sediminis]
MSHITLDFELTRFTALRRQIIEADPEIDETTLLDTLEGATNLHEAIGALVRSALEDECLVTGLKARLGELKERLDRIQIRIDNKRQLALSTMEEAGIEKILEPDFTLSLRATPPSVLVTDETVIPEWFWIPQPA